MCIIILVVKARVTLFDSALQLISILTSVYTHLYSSSLAVHEECYSAADRHSLKPSCQIWDHVWSLRRVRHPGGDHRQFLGGETAGNSLWQIKPCSELTLPSDELSMNLLPLGGEKNDRGASFVICVWAETRTKTHELRIYRSVIDHWSLSHHRSADGTHDSFSANMQLVK